MGLQFLHTYHTLQTLLTQNVTVTELKGSIIHLDEVLTMSTRMAVATGGHFWEKRYKEHEPHLDQAIKAIIAMAAHKKLRDVAEETNNANVELVKIEYEAFRLVKENQRIKAEKFLLSSSYNEQKTRYSQGMNKYTTLLNEYVEGNVDSAKHKAYLILLLISISILALLCVWGLTLKFVHTWHRTLEQARKDTEHSNECLEKVLKEIEKKNIELENFTHIASHDLQEPLRTIFSFVQLLEKSAGKFLDNESRSYMLHIKDGVNRMGSLVNDLLTYSKVRSCIEPFNELDCNYTIAHVLKLLDAVIKENNVTINCGPLPLIKGEATQIIQLFQNILTNAIKYHSMDVSPILDIDVVSQENYWLFSLRDNGIGIDSENLVTIFTPFTRLHSNREYTGTGIGLANCKKIIENHGGSIWVESQPGKGSIFYFTLPKISAPLTI